jgi:hypothetical protein
MICIVVAGMGEKLRDGLLAKLLGIIAVLFGTIKLNIPVMKCFGFICFLEVTPLQPQAQNQFYGTK